MLLAIGAAMTVYHGATSRHLVPYFIIGVVFEMAYGFPIGVLSVAFAVSCLGLVALQRVITMTPWESKEGWSLLDALRSLVLSWLLYLATLGVSVAVSGFLYDQTSAWLRMQSLVTSQVVSIPLVWMALTMMSMRRVVVPFRRVVRYGL